MALTDNLLAFYKLSDLTDSSGNNRTLTNNGNVSFASGKIGNAAVFDGSYPNHLIKSGSNLTNFGSGDFAISCFYKPTTQITPYAAIFTTYEVWPSPYSGIGLFDRCGRDTDKFALVIADAGSLGEWHFNDSSVVDEQWYHIVITRNSGQLKWFINGNIAADIQNSTNFGDDFLSLGADNPGGGVVNGQIDAFGIWNRALSDSEVAALYNSGAGIELDNGGNGGGGNPTLVKMEAPIKFFGKVKFGV